MNLTPAAKAIVDTIHDCVAPIDGYEEETASAVITALKTAGYSILPTRLLMGWQMPEPLNSRPPCGVMPPCRPGQPCEHYPPDDPLHVHADCCK